MEGRLTDKDAPVVVYCASGVRSALRIHSGNRLRAAVELGISRCYLHRLLNQFNMADAAGSPDALDEPEQGS